MTWTLSDKYVVLIVDDLPANLAMLSDALDDSNHIVLVATDGESAIDRLNYATPDIILLDAMMPGMDGFETCRRIKLLEGMDRIPVVFMTALTDTEHVLKGFQAGGIDYVTKPIRPAEVIARINTHVHNARLLSQARSAIDAAEQAVIALGADKMPIWITSKAVTWLEKYFPDVAPSLTALPPPVQCWLQDQTGGVEGATAAMTVKHELSVLTVRLVRAAPGGEHLLMLQEAPSTRQPADRIAGYNLTPRETDVLAWLSKGKTNRDIADILGMSPRTVNKHLEHIFVKLGVETRSAAAALSMTWLHGTMEPSWPA